MRKMKIAIDGPAGAGKSTIAKRLAAELRFIYVDTGAMYRALAVDFLRRGLAVSDEESIVAAANEDTVTLSYEEGEQQVFLNGENVTGLLRTEEVGNMASASSAYAGVRAKLTASQKKLAEEADVVMDGRDIGTAVLPDAEVKIYLTASTRTRAERRYRELMEKNGTAPELSVIERDIAERDDRDMHREAAPLTQAKDAVYLDSSALSVEEVVAKIRDIIKEKTGL